jgi:hypothetical protein
MGLIKVNERQIGDACGLMMPEPPNPAHYSPTGANILKSADNTLVKRDTWS